MELITKYIDENNEQFANIKKLNNKINELMNKIDELQKENENLAFKVKMYEQFNKNSINKNKRV